MWRSSRECPTLKNIIADRHTAAPFPSERKRAYCLERAKLLANATVPLVTRSAMRRIGDLLNSTTCCSAIGPSSSAALKECSRRDASGSEKAIEGQL